MQQSVWHLSRKQERTVCIKEHESENLSDMSDSLRPHGACQALLSMGFSRQEYWSGLSFPSPINSVKLTIESINLY